MFDPGTAFIIFLFSIAFAFFVSFFWFWIFYRLDKADPEPKRLIVKLIIFGALIAIPLAFLEVFIFSIFPWFESESPALIFISMFIFIAPIEEYGKYWILRRLVLKRAEFNQVIDGVIYAVAVALGFALLENIGYFGEVIFPSKALSYGASPVFILVFTLLFRFLFTTLMHATASGIVGYRLGQAKLLDPQKSGGYIRNGLLLAVFLHGSFNFFLQAGVGYYSILILVALAVYLFKKFKVPQNTAIFYPRRFCGSCGVPIAESAHFCGRCGAKI